MGAPSIGLLETPSLQALFGCEVLYIDVFDPGHTTHHHPVCCSYIKVLHFHFYKAQLCHAITSVQHIEQSFTNPFSSSMTLLRRACQDPALPPQSDMAPHLMDSKGFILQNCRVSAESSDADFEVLTRIDLSRQWHAFVLKTEGGKRTKYLEEKAPRPERALELLHEASARLVDQYVTCHGYDLPPGATKSSSGMRGGSVKPDVIACSSSDSEAFASDSDDSALPPRRSHRRSHRSGRAAGEAANTRPDRAEADSGSDSDGPTSRRAPFWGGSPPRPAGMPSHGHPPPPQPWGYSMPIQAQASAPAPAPAPIPGIRPGPSMVPPPPGRSISIPPMVGKSYPARLNITWPGNGKRNMLVNVSPTVHYLQQVAVNEANMRPTGFVNSSSAPYLPLPNRSSNGHALLRAMVRRVTLNEDDTYEIAAFGNDLSALFRSTSSIPKFEIEIINAHIVPIFPPMPPPPRPASVASSRSSVEIAD
ncbi:hypothetical protein FOVG_10629 [Fusarium oxysporum f. sp. pisi HDV247]|uniref:Uncharacterized protein n=1 Tax=Fusarium oxysporum f. sp. pisi HDV247 TaxID=1080344 RepID=W9P1D0_FUSOX|nr:hypothetical protein FOVG_10629 [Fusarium oxysporum f. sp. pisi HDV247]